MAYEVNYTLETSNIPDDQWDDLLDHFDMFDVGHLLVDGQARMPWYKHEADLIYISARFPNITFTLTGVGELREDLWKKRFRASEVEELRPDIVWPEWEELV